MKTVATDAKFTKRFVTGDYEWEEYSVSAIVSDGQSAEQVLLDLKNQVSNAFVGVVVKAEETAEPKKGRGRPKGSKNVSTKASASDNFDGDDEDSEKQDGKSDSQGNQYDEAPDDEDNFADDDSGSHTADEFDNDSDDDDEEEAEDESGNDGDSEVKIVSKKGKTAAAQKSGKKFKKKEQTYNRSIEQHKELFSGVLRAISPDWKKSDKMKALAKKASEEMEGEVFLDENGEVLENFRTLVSRLLKGKNK